MRLPPLPTLTVLALLAGCGQKGPLVLPDTHTASPVVIRGPAAQPPARPGDAAPPPAKPRADDPDAPPQH